MEIKKVYVAYSTVDEFGRRGSRHGTFTSSSKADTEAIGIGWWGGKGSVISEYVIIVDGVAYPLSSPNPVDLDITSVEAKEMKEKLKNSGLAKLTECERKALGI